jgi:hypothetical protein
LFRATGHFITEERPDELSKIIEVFVDGKPLPAEWAPPAGSK